MRFLERYYRGKFLEEQLLAGQKQQSAVRQWTGLANLGQEVEPIVIPVTEEAALKTSVFFSAVSVLAQSIAMLPLMTYRRLPNDERQKADDIPEYKMLKDRINFSMTSYEWRFATMVKLLMKGNSFTRLFWDLDRKKVLAMRHLDFESYNDLGAVVEITYKNSLRTETIPKSELLHLKWFTEDGVTGQGLVEKCTKAVGFLIAAERYGMSFFANGAVPFVLLIHPGTLGETAAENIRASWKKKYQNRGHEPAVLEEGMQVETINVPNDKAQFLELRTFQLQEVARFFRITPHKLQDLERATFSNVVELNQSFVIDSLMPITTNIQQRIQLDIFGLRDELFCEFKFDDLLRGNTRDRYEAYRLAIQNRLLTVDEVRRLENRNDLTDAQIERMIKVMQGVNDGGDKTSPNVPTGREAQGIKEVIHPVHITVGDKKRKMKVTTPDGRIFQAEISPNGE